MTLLIVFLYVGFAITLVSIWWLTTRLREHEDLLLDLYLMLSDVHESLTPPPDKYADGGASGDVHA